MSDSNYLEDIDVVILCGGRGTRICRIAQDVPKPMLVIKGRPFLDILIEYALSYGLRRFVLCIGYKRDVIGDYYKLKGGMANVVFSNEEEPLGTGGAIKNAAGLIRSDPFLVMNGDSFCRIDFKEFAKFHTEKKALASVALTGFQKNRDCGYVDLNSFKQIIRFREKGDGDESRYVSVGIYFFDREIFSLMPQRKAFSLERDFFPALRRDKFYGYITKSDFIDIGIPERYKRAKELWSIWR